jgi:hypothetical protein
VPGVDVAEPLESDVCGVLAIVPSVPAGVWMAASALEGCVAVAAIPTVAAGWYVASFVPQAARLNIMPTARVPIKPMRLMFFIFPTLLFVSSLSIISVFPFCYDVILNVLYSRPRLLVLTTSAKHH